MTWICGPDRQQLVYGTTVLCGHDSQLSAVLSPRWYMRRASAAQTPSQSPYQCSCPAVCLIKQGSRTGGVSPAASGSWMLCMLTSPWHGGCGQCRDNGLYVWKMWLPVLNVHPWLCGWVSAVLGELISFPFRDIKKALLLPAWELAGVSYCSWIMGRGGKGVPSCFRRSLRSWMKDSGLLCSPACIL